MREKKIEQYLVSRMKARGFICLKFSVPAVNGYPDRICLIPRGKVFFVEIKAPGKQPAEHQKRILEKLEQFGYSC